MRVGPDDWIRVNAIARIAQATTRSGQRRDYSFRVRGPSGRDERKGDEAQLCDDALLAADELAPGCRRRRRELCVHERTTAGANDGGVVAMDEREQRPRTAEWLPQSYWRCASLELASWRWRMTRRLTQWPGYSTLRCGQPIQRRLAVSPVTCSGTPSGAQGPPWAAGDRLQRLPLFD